MTQDEYPPLETVYRQQRDYWRIEAQKSADQLLAISAYVDRCLGGGRNVALEHIEALTRGAGK